MSRAGRFSFPNKAQGGFVITLELVLILTVLGIGLFVGMVAIRDSVVKYYVNQQSQEVTISDANGTVLGRAMGFDEHESPLVYYIDRTMAPPPPDPQHRNYRALIGVRDDRFTSREPIYYTELNCQGQPCIKTPSSELSDNRGVDGLPGTGAVSYIYGLQGGPTYAVGRSSDGIPGFLFRSTFQTCPVGVAESVLGSRYISQKVEHGEPCESPYTLPLPTGVLPRTCTGKANNPVRCPQSGPLACGSRGRRDCACPVGYFDAGASVGLVGQCCPNGYTLESGALSNGGVTCTGAGLVLAESVPDPDNANLNAFESFTPPFSVNLPINAGSDDSWEYIAPRGEGVPDYTPP